MATYEFHGRFKIVTDCSDVERVAKTLNETARQFADIMDFNEDGRGYMWIYNDVELDIPVNDQIQNELEEEENVQDEE